MKPLILDQHVLRTPKHLHRPAKPKPRRTLDSSKVYTYRGDRCRAFLINGGPVSQLEEPLYPARVGMRCRVVGCVATGVYPYVVMFEDGWRGIASAASLEQVGGEPARTTPSLAVAGASAQSETLRWDSGHDASGRIVEEIR